MLTKLNRNNTNFQIAYFIAGSCHTADAAYLALINQRQDRQRALDSVEVSKIKQQAQRLRCEQRIASSDPIEQLEGRADLLELELDLKHHQDLVQAAQAELDFINLCIERIQPLRKYAHLSDAEASELCQAEEWAYELRYRAENFMLTQGTIPHDHFATMRQHPSFNTFLLPHIERLQLGLAQPGGYQQLLLERTKTFDLPRLVGLESVEVANPGSDGQIELL